MKKQGLFLRYSVSILLVLTLLGSSMVAYAENDVSSTDAENSSSASESSSTPVDSDSATSGNGSSSSDSSMSPTSIFACM